MRWEKRRVGRVREGAVGGKGSPAVGGSRVGGWMVEVLELSEGWGAEAEAENGVP